MEPIDLRMASVREARNAERRFCFEVITPQFKRIYQATSEEDMKNWIRAINNALQSAFEVHGASNPLPPPPPKKESGTSIGRDIGSVLTGKSLSHSGQHSYSGTMANNSNNSSSINNNVHRSTTVGARPSYVRAGSNGAGEDPAKFLQTVREADKGNYWCADCQSTSKVEWVSINLGIVLCIECSGIHRSLGTHISKVRSLTLDVRSFSTDIVEILLQIGNRVSNMVWEATLDQTQKPSAEATREQRLKFINAKYSERAFVQPLSSSRSPFHTSDEVLLASIKRNDIHGVLYGIALKANVNSTDLSRHTHAVFLALAAADPASPGTPTSSSRPPSASVKEIPFPIAELLIQNGAEIPSQQPTITLSRAAQLYISQRKSRPGTSSARLGNTPSGESITSLPTIRTSGVNPLLQSSGAPVETKEPKEREREKLHKRGSAGARLAGKVASLGIDR